MVRGLERKKIFRDDKDREEFLTRLEKSLSKSSSECHAWCLMPNHFHLLIRTSTKPLSSLMGSLLTSYALYFNAKHKRRGYLFQNRYKSVLCQEEEYYLELVRYIHLNPLRSGIVETLSKLGRYPWTGHSVLMGKKKRGFQVTDEVLSHFASKEKRAISLYSEFVKDGIAMGRQEHLTGGGLRRSAGGWTEVIELKKRNEYWKRDDRILGDGEFVSKALKAMDESLDKEAKMKRDGWSLEALVKRVCEEFGVDPKDLRKKGRKNDLSEAKSVLCFWGNGSLGIKGSELARYLGITQPAVSHNIKKGEKIVEERGINLLNKGRPF